jgi:hypothetical protein
VDPNDAGPPGGRFEAFDANDRFVVIRDEQGYGVWRLEDLEDGDPIERFSDDDEGYEAAAATWKALTKADRRGSDRFLPWIKWFVVISAVVWVGTAVLISILLPQVNFSYGGRGLFQTLSRWGQMAQIVAQPATISGLAVYVVLWLESRRQR